MKLKEKLAEQYGKYNTQFEDEFTNDKRAFLAGFEKAREMALALFQSSYTRGGLENLIEHLGEEEVE